MMFLAYLPCVLLASLAAATTIRPPVTNSPPIVDLGYSKFQGTTLQNGVTQFLGIPYAAPPVGNLRFRAPRPPLPSKKVQLAQEWSPLCLGATDRMLGGESEDCLHISVYKPTSAKTTAKLPVLVFIQGGGYGALMNSHYNGSELIQNSDNGAVFVHFNYRVGAYGFLASEQVRNDGDLNAGLLDQQFALKWVQKHISKFGGNPGRVVIHGVSAGAGSVAHHLAANGGRNQHLFHGAIGTSVYFPILPKPVAFEFQYQRLIKSVGCADARKPLQCLRAVPAETIQRFHAPQPFPNRKAAPIFDYSPVVDGKFIQSPLYEAYAKGRFINVPAIIGHDTNEGTYFAPDAESDEDIQAFFQDNYPSLTNAEVKKITQIYNPQTFPAVLGRTSHFDAAEAALADSIFICPGASIQNKLSKPFAYRGAVVDGANVAAGLGVPHTWITPAMLGVANSGTGTGYETYNREVVDKTMDYVKSFIQHLDPNVSKNATAPMWPVWRKDHQRLVLENKPYVEREPKAQRERCEFWWRLKNMQQ